MFVHFTGVVSTAQSVGGKTSSTIASIRGDTELPGLISTQQSLLTSITSGTITSSSNEIEPASPYTTVTTVTTFPFSSNSISSMTANSPTAISSTEANIYAEYSTTETINESVPEGSIFRPATTSSWLYNSSVSLDSSVTRSTTQSNNVTPLPTTNVGNLSNPVTSPKSSDATVSSILTSNESSVGTMSSSAKPVFTPATVTETPRMTPTPFVTTYETPPSPRTTSTTKTSTPTSAIKYSMLSSIKQSASSVAYSSSNISNYASTSTISTEVSTGTLGFV